MCRGGGGGPNLYLLCLISNTLPQLEQSSMHPQQFSVIASCYRPPATTISVFSYTSTAPVKKNRSSNRLGTPLSLVVEKPEGSSALQPTTEIKSGLRNGRYNFEKPNIWKPGQWIIVKTKRNYLLFYIPNLYI